MKRSALVVAVFALASVGCGEAAPQQTVGRPTSDAVATSLAPTSVPAQEFEYVITTTQVDGSPVRVDTRLQYASGRLWQKSSRQPDGELVCEYRVADVSWITTGASCDTAALASVQRIGDGDTYSFPIGDEIMRLSDWQTPDPMEGSVQRIPAAEVNEGRSQIGDLDDAFVAQLDGGAVQARWSTAEDLILPIRYELTADDYSVVADLTAVRDGGELFAQVPPDISAALQAEEQLRAAGGGVGVTERPPD